jgi:NTE family protein
VDQTYHTPTAPDYLLEYSQVEGVGQLSFDTVDDASFPRHGFLGEIGGRMTGTSVGAPAAASMGTVSAMGAFSSERHTVRLKGQWANNFNNTHENSYLQRLGGFLNLGGYSQNSLIGTEKALAQTQYLYKVGELGGKPFYGGAAAEWGGVWNQGNEFDAIEGLFSGTVMVGLDTGIGPAYLGFSKGEGKAKSVYLYVGQAF